MTKIISKNLFSNSFSENLLRWNRTENGRKMPWKGEKDPYRIWLSEIILQQTRVEQGLKYYQTFIKTFPNIEKLAKSEEKKVFKLWEGLGYYSRCRNLIATARFIVNERKGIFPGEYEEILKLKGVGPYTAAAIASFAYNQPHAVIDGNVFRVLARYFGIETPIDGTDGKKQFTTLANELLDRKHPGEYNQAIMDFGATVCKPLAPLCEACVFQSHCVAFKTGKVNELPVKEKKLKQKTRFFYFFLLGHKDLVAVKERSEKDIWRHLYQFPAIETGQKADVDEVIATAVQTGWLRSAQDVTAISEEFVQKLTHQTIKGVFITATVRQKSKLTRDHEWVQREELNALAFPRMLKIFLEKGILRNNFSPID